MLDLLNDDCLSEIFQYLNVKEQLIVTAVSERFCDIIVENFWRVKYSKFTTKDDASCNELNLADFQIFYGYIAPHIQELTVHSTANIAFTSYLGRYTKRPDLAFYFHFEYPALRVLRCYDSQFHGGYLTRLQRKCPHLEILHLHSSYVSGEYLAELPNLRELYVCSNTLEAKWFDAIFTKRKLLRIHIMGETCVKRDMDVVLKNIFPQITELRYYDDEAHIATQDLFLNSAQALRNLAKLFCRNLKDYVYSLHTLRELYFESHLRVDDLFMLINNNVHLEHLYMGTNFNSLLPNARDWLCELTERLREQQDRKCVLNIHLDLPLRVVQQVRQLLEDYNFQCGYMKSVIIISKQPVDTSKTPFLISKTGIEFALKWS
ncbi:uncharacterized protein LOC101455399 [Ceratitis capitata]|uniref:uncharacterized protein LOC101455399 n=1 Tax=Ceratitis capitata TaxID=7213 RepID=UPI00032A2E35|nr:uncharacterized protein LOC101455399 [Ceratitis capitata]